MNRQITAYQTSLTIPRPQVDYVIPQQTATPQQLGINISELMEPLITMMIVMSMMKMMMTMMAPSKPKKLPFPLPEGYEPVGEYAETKPSIVPLLKAKRPSGLRPTSEGKEEERRAESRTQEAQTENRRVQLVQKGEEIARQAGGGIKFLRLDEGWQVKYAVIRYWFVDERGWEIVASSLAELRYKLEVTGH